MNKLPILARALAFVSLAAHAGRLQDHRGRPRTSASIPSDYRLRHPIAVRERRADR